LSGSFNGLAVVTFLGGREGGEESGHVVPIDGDGVPIETLKIVLGVPPLRHLGHGVEGDVIGIINENEVIEFIVTGESDGFLGHPAARNLLLTGGP